MIDWGRWLPGMGGEDEDDPVSKTLRALGQGASGIGSTVASYLPGSSGSAPEDYSSATIAPPTRVEGSAAPFQDSYEPAPKPEPPTFAPEDYSTSAITERHGPAPESPSAGASLGTIASDIGDTLRTEGVVGPIARPISTAIRTATGRAPLTPEEEAERTPASVRAIDEAVRETARSLPANVEAARSSLETGDYLGAGFGALGAIGDLAPSTLLARQLNELLPKADTPLGEVGAGDVVMTAALAHDAARLGYGVIKAGGRIGAPLANAIAEGVPVQRVRDWLTENAERVARADARMAAEGSTAAPGTLGQIPEQFGRPYPDIRRDVRGVVREQLGEPSAEMLADSRFPRDVVHPDLRAAGIGPEITPQIDLSERANAGFGVVPPSERGALREAQLRVQDANGAYTTARIQRAEIERQLNRAPGDPELQQNLMGAIRREEEAQGTLDAAREWHQMVQTGDRTLATSGIVPDAARTDRLAGVNRILGQGLASSVSGGVGAQLNEQMNPDDPNAGFKGFAVGALGPLAATRGARALSRLAGAESRGAEGALAAFGQAPGAGGSPTGLPAKALARWQVAGQKAAAQAAAARAAGKAPPPTAGEWLKTIGYSGMIGPSTGLVNAIGNGFELLYAVPKELARAAVRGQPGEAAELGRGLLEGFGRAGGEVLDALRGAHPGGGVETPRLSQRATTGAGRMAGTALEAPMRIFSEAPDAFYRAIAESVGERRAAAQVATSEGLTGRARAVRVQELVDDAAAVRGGQLAQHAPTQQVLDEGAALGERLTLRGQTGPAGQAIKTAMDRLPFGLGNLIMPFFNTPYQMTQRALERTPYGLRMGTQPTQFDRVYDATVGSAVGAGMLGLAGAGVVSGSGPSDPDQRKMLQAQGWQNNSTLVAGRWVPNNVFGVWGPVLDTAGELADAMRYQKVDASSRDLGGDLANRVGKVVKNQVYLKGLADILNAIEAEGEQREAFAASLAGRAIPLGATARLAATMSDPLERRAEPAKEVGFFQNVAQRVESQLPGLRQTLPAAQDVLGRPQANPRAGVAALGPRTRQPSPDPVLERYVGAGLEIGAPRTDITEDGIKIDLSPSETRRWNELRGEELTTRTQRLIDNGALDRLPEARRKERLEEIKADAAERASERLRREIGAAEFSRRRREAVQKAKAS